MVSALADECLNGAIVRAVRRRLVAASLVSVAEVGLMEQDDRTILQYAARQGLVVVTSDERTMIGFAFERVRAGMPMPGLVVVPQSWATGEAIDRMAVALECYRASELEPQVRFLPL